MLGEGDEGEEEEDEEETVIREEEELILFSRINFFQEIRYFLW